MPISAQFICCDDIRYEANGKMMFIGVYPEDLVPNVLPQLLTLSFWIRLQGVAAGTHALHFAVGSNEAVSLEADLTMVVEPGKELSYLTLVGLPVQLTDYGQIFLRVTGFPDGSSVVYHLPVVQPPALRA